LDPATLPIGAAIQIARFTWKGAVAGRDLKEASQAIGEVLPTALAEALCEARADSDEVRHAVDVLAAQLQKVAVPGQTEPGFFKRTLASIRGRTPPAVRPRHVPAVTAFGPKPFEQLLEEWIAVALEDQGVAAVVGAVNCAGAKIDRAQFARDFPTAFFFALAGAPHSRWRESLLNAMKEEHEGREFIEAKSRQLLRGRGLVLDLTAGATAGAAGGALAGGEPKWVVLAAVLGLGFGGAGHAAGRRSKASLTNAQVAARQAVRNWLTDLATTIEPEITKFSNHQTPDDGAEDSSAVTIGRWALKSQTEATANFSRELMDDLADRLIRAAKLADDDELLGALMALDDSLVRWQRDTTTQEQVISALKVVIVTVADST
jgi:hypothetical protein